MKKLTLCLIAAALHTQTALADTALPPSRKESLKTVEKKLETERAAAARLEEKEQSLKMELSGLQKNLVSTTSAVRQQERALLRIEANLDRLQQDVREKSATLTQDQETLSELITALTRLARLPPAALLARQNAPVDAARSTALLNSALPQIQSRTADIRLQLDELDAKKRDLEQQQTRHEAEQARLQARQRELDILVAQRTSIYDRTHARRVQQLERVTALSHQASTLQDLITRLDRTPSRTRPPALPPAKALNGAVLPVTGKIVLGYGEEDEFGSHSKGMRIKGRGGATVVAPLAGTVRFAGPFQSYSHILIVEHEGGYHSLIAGLSRITTVVGETVLAGEPVGTAGSEKDKGGVVYYELRYNGKPVNPGKYITAGG